MQTRTVTVVFLYMVVLCWLQSDLPCHALVSLHVCSLRLADPHMPKTMLTVGMSCKLRQQLQVGLQALSCYLCTLLCTGGLLGVAGLMSWRLKFAKALLL